MIIDISKVSAKLETFARLYHKEFSGFGFIERKGDVLEVYDIVILDVGSEYYTEIDTNKILELMQRPDADKMKLWLHKHPIDVWSATDNTTIKESPLGGLPQLVKWSASIVLTPHGWIGRVDSYKTGETIVCEVVPNEYLWAKTTLDAILLEKHGRVEREWKLEPRVRDAYGRFAKDERFIQGRFAGDELDPEWADLTDDEMQSLRDDYDDDLVEEEDDNDLSPYEKEELKKSDNLFDWVARAWRGR